MLVAYQVNQTAVLTKDRLSFDRWSDEVSFRISLLGENPDEILAKAFTKPMELSPSDLFVVDTYYRYHLGRIVVTKRLGARGIISADEWREVFDEDHRNTTRSWFGCSVVPSAKHGGRRKEEPTLTQRLQRR